MSETRINNAYKTIRNEIRKIRKLRDVHVAESNIRLEQKLVESCALERKVWLEKVDETTEAMLVRLLSVTEWTREEKGSCSYDNDEEPCAGKVTGHEIAWYYRPKGVNNEAFVLCDLCVDEGRIPAQVSAVADGYYDMELIRDQSRRALDRDHWMKTANLSSEECARCKKQAAELFRLIHVLDHDTYDNWVLCPDCFSHLDLHVKEVTAPYREKCGDAFFDDEEEDDDQMEKLESVSDEEESPKKRERKSD